MSKLRHKERLKEESRDQFARSRGNQAAVKWTLTTFTSLTDCTGDGNPNTDDPVPREIDEGVQEVQFEIVSRYAGSDASDDCRNVCDPIPVRRVGAEDVEEGE